MPTDEYGDSYDVMGGSWDQVGSLNSVQAARLGVLPDDQVQNLTASAGAGTYALAPLSGTSGTRVVELTAPSGQLYTLEFRQASGQDSYLGNSAQDWVGLRQGVLLHRAVSDSTADSSLLLDGTPTADSTYASDDDDVLGVGTTVPVACGQLSVTVTSVTATGAELRVTTPSTAISTAYAASGGSAGLLGAPTGTEVCAPDGSASRSFQNGTMYWTPVTGAHSVASPLQPGFAASGGP